MLWAGDQRKKMLVNTEAYGGDVALLTATAPGTDGVTYWHQNPGGRWVDVPGWAAYRLPWDPARPGKVVASEAHRWNRSAPQRWRRLHRAAAQRARRLHGRFSLVANSWEFQKRELLHRHLVLGMATPRERAAAHTYALALEELGPRYGFGFISDTRRNGSWRRRGLEVIPAQRAGRYVAKYLSPLDGDGKPTLSATVTRADVPAHVTYVSRELTQRTGCTMRYLRHVRHCYVLGIHPRTGETMGSLMDNTIAHAMATGENPLDAIARAHCF